MHKLSEEITLRFAELFGAIHHAADDLKLAGAEAILVGDFSQVDEINHACQALQELDVEVKAVLEKFKSKHKSRQLSEKSSFKRTRTYGGHIRVKIADKVIEKETIAETFVEALEMFGLERVAKLNKFVLRTPLLAKSPLNENSYQRQRKIGTWYIMSHVNKKIASKVLGEIGKELNIPVKVEVVERRS